MLKICRLCLSHLAIINGLTTIKGYFGNINQMTKANHCCFDALQFNQEHYSLK